MLIKKIQFKLQTSDPEWTEIVFQKNSAIFRERPSRERPGNLYTIELTAYCPHISPEKDQLFLMLLEVGAIFAVTKIDDSGYIFGSDSMRALFFYNKLDGDKPGSKSGYDIKISHISAFPSTLASFG